MQIHLNPLILLYDWTSKVMNSTLSNTNFDSNKKNETIKISQIFY